MRKSIIVAVLSLFFLIPAVVFAQDKIIELVFSADGSQVSITDTFTTTAAVSMEVNGTQYLMKIPITVDIDSTLPLTSSMVTVENTTRVGSFGVEIIGTEESTDTVEVVIPNLFGDSKEDFEPSQDGNKIVVVRFNLTNLGVEEDSLSSYSVQGLDDMGRLFEDEEFGCETVNPGEVGRCVAVFDVVQAVDIVALDIEVPDHRQIPIPRQ